MSLVLKTCHNMSQDSNVRDPVHFKRPKLERDPGLLSMGAEYKGGGGMEILTHAQGAQGSMRLDWSERHGNRSFTEMNKA